MNKETGRGSIRPHAWGLCVHNNSLCDSTVWAQCPPAFRFVFISRVTPGVAGWGTADASLLLYLKGQICWYMVGWGEKNEHIDLIASMWFSLMICRFHSQDILTEPQKNRTFHFLAYSTINPAGGPKENLLFVQGCGFQRETPSAGGERWTITDFELNYQMHHRDARETSSSFCYLNNGKALKPLQSP